jgi:hypothetical protein
MTNAEVPPPPSPQGAPLSENQWLLAFGVLAWGVGMGLFWVLKFNARVDTAATYVGIPTLIAFILATTPRSKSRTGTILKGMAIALALVGMTLGPGVFCLFISAPLFLTIGVLVGRILDANSTPHDRNVRVAVVAAALALASIEGLHPSLTVDPAETVEFHHKLSMSVDEFGRRLAKTPVFDLPLPFPLNLGLPAPVRASGSGTEVGARRAVHLEDRNVYFTLVGKSGRQDGDVVFEVAQAGEIHGGREVVFKLVSDDSHVSKWLRWKQTRVYWRTNGMVRGEPQIFVFWTVSYDRQLAPAWYFGPILRYAARRTAELIAETVAAQRD